MLTGVPTPPEPVCGNSVTCAISNPLLDDISIYDPGQIEERAHKEKATRRSPSLLAFTYLLLPARWDWASGISRKRVGQGRDFFFELDAALFEVLLRVIVEDQSRIRVLRGAL